MTDDYNGSTAFDSSGNNIGTVERTYVDDDGQAGMLALKIGSILAKHRLVPTDAMTPEEDGVHLGWSRETIESSPSLDYGDTLEGDALDSIRQYYAAHGIENQTEPEDPETLEALSQADQRNRPADDIPRVIDEGTPPGLDRVRDLGDVVEVPIVEEVLVKRSVVKQVLRIRKSQLDEAGLDTSDLQQNRMEVVPNEEASTATSGASSSNLG